VDAPDVTTTTASRRSFPGWLRGALVIAGSGIAAGYIYANSLDPLVDDGRALALPVVVVIGGGILAANQADPPFSRRRLLRFCLMPLPTVLLLVFALLALGVYQDDFAATYSLTVALVGLWEVPLFVTLLVRSRKEQQVHQELQRLRVPFGPPPLEGELAEATRNSRSPTVIREYIDDRTGQEHLDADEVALLAHGYELVSVEEKRRPEAVRTLGQLFTLLFLRTIPDAESNNDRIVATFQRRPK
jgi:hypothetical protein